MYDFSGNHLPHPYERENLLERRYFSRDRLAGFRGKVPG